MSYFVICPQCHEENSGSLLACAKCGTNLVGVQRQSRSTPEEAVSNDKQDKFIYAHGKKLIVVPQISGTEVNVTVTIRNAVFQKNEGYSMQYPDPEFGAWLMEQLYNNEKIFATKRGLFRKGFWCPSCNTQLNPESRAPIDSTYELVFLDYPSFFIDISMPSVICPQCQKICGINSDGTLDFNLAEAMVHAFDSKYIRP